MQFWVIEMPLYNDTLIGHFGSALPQVRRLRCRTAVETRKQEDFVARYAKHLQRSDLMAPGSACVLATQHVHT